jgi:methyl-accepting chemotaxis protein
MLTIPFSRARLAEMPAPGQRRAIALNVMIFFAFALTALIFLTKSAVAANAINRDVGESIAPTTMGIDSSTSKIPQLDQTMVLTGKIADGTRTLSAHLAHVVGSTKNIEANLAAIQGDVTGIGESVNGINSTVSAIRPEIFTLGGSINGIHSKAGDISSRLSQVGADTSTMTVSLDGIDKSLTDVLARTAPLNRRVAGIKNTLGVVNGYTLSIANSPILLSAFPFPPLALPDLLGTLGLSNILGGGPR